MVADGFTTVFFLFRPCQSTHELYFDRAKRTTSLALQLSLQDAANGGEAGCISKKDSQEKAVIQKKCDLNAFTYNQTGFKIESNKLILSRIDGIRIVLHRQPINPKQVIVSRESAEGGTQLQLATYYAGNILLLFITGQLA